MAVVTYYRNQYLLPHWYDIRPEVTRVRFGIYGTELAAHQFAHLDTAAKLRAAFPGWNIPAYAYCIVNKDVYPENAPIKHGSTVVFHIPPEYR